MLDLKSCVWITGASSGIGGDLALKMASEGLNVAISARSTKKLIQVLGQEHLLSDKNPTILINLCPNNLEYSLIVEALELLLGFCISLSS